MAAPLARVTLRGDRVRLEPLSLDHAEGLAEAAAEDRSTYGLTWVPDGTDAMCTYIDELLAERSAGKVLPFAQVSVATGRPLGCTRYLDMYWWRGRPHPDEVEIGGTWLAGSAQRTGINTEAKYLLLAHAFEVYEAWRVQIVTDARNIRSREAIERIGATFEGVLRNHRTVADTTVPSPRQAAIYSVIAEEWPSVRSQLRGRLDGAA
jgi:RimJ/RimL family protein N-acetyltransferase